MEQNSQEFNSAWGGIIFIIVGICFIIYVIYAIVSFKSERDYIKMEMARSANEKERKYWEEELKRLYISKIPVIGDLLINDEKGKEYSDEYDV